MKKDSPLRDTLIRLCQVGGIPCSTGNSILELETLLANALRSRPKTVTLSDLHKRIIVQIRAGHDTEATIARALNESVVEIRQQLRRLHNARLIASRGSEKWAIAVRGD